MPRPGRVLIVVQNLPVPFDRRVWLEATTLQRAGYEVSVICPKMKGFNASFEVREGVHIYRYRLPIDAEGPLGFATEFLWCFLRTALLTVRLTLSGRGFDVLHVCNPPETYWPLAAAWRRLGKRFIFDHHDLSPEMYEAKFDGGSRRVVAALRFLERRTFETADVVIAANTSHERVAVERGGVPPEDVFVVRSGPDLTRFTRYDPDPAWRHGKPFVLVYLGEICKQDGVEHLVRALRILRDDFGRDDFHCLFVGGGPHQPAVQRYADEIGVTAHCTFTGNVTDDDLLSRILSSADVGVVPDPCNSYSDRSTMNKVMEYMFFGLPVVGFDLTENRRSAGDAALWAEPNSERDLAAQITALLDDPERTAKMGEHGEQRVADELAWEYSATVLLAAYRKAFATPEAAH